MCNRQFSVVVKQFFRLQELRFVKVALVQIQCYINIAMFYNLIYYLELTTI